MEQMTILEKFEDMGYKRSVVFGLLGTVLSFVLPIFNFCRCKPNNVYIRSFFYPNYVLMSNILVIVFIIGVLCLTFFVFSVDDIQPFGPLGGFIHLI